MGSNIFTSALSGMNAAQVGLATTQHNIANASTPGFTRQDVLVTTNTAQSFGGGFIGQGVHVAGVQRIYDQFLSTQILQEQSQASYLSAYHGALKQIDNLVSDPAAGASPAMRDFFSAMNGVANNPESIPARQTLLGNAQFVANRFQAIDQRLTDVANGLTSQISNSVNSINSYAQQIATLNGNIKRAIASGQGQQPNDLLDQRDQLITKLNQEIKATTLRQPDGTMSVFIGTGQTLVVDEQAMSMQVIQSALDPSKVDVAYRNNNITVTMQQSSLQGGNLGAYLAFRDNSLEPMRNELGRVALGMAISVNQQNQVGLDLRGQMGERLFNVAAPRVDINANNQGTAVMSATIADVNALTTSDYRLKMNGVNSYTMIRLSDNFMTNMTSLPQTVDGFTVSLASGVAKSGDSFLIRPTANAARDIAVTMSDPARVAAAAPMRSTAAISVKANLLSATTASVTAAVSGVTANDPANANLVAPVSITFDASVPGAEAYTVAGAVPPVAAPVPYVPGNPINLSYNGWTTQITGTPTHGDVVNIAPSTAIISGVSVINPSNAKLTAPAKVTFSDPAAPPQTYTVSDVSGAVPVVLGTGNYVAGGVISYNGWAIQVSGTPVAGDIVNIGVNSGAATVSSESVNLNPVSINFTSATAYDVAEMRGTPPAAVTIGSGLIPPAVGGSSTVSYNGWTTQIAGIPAANDKFTVVRDPNSTTTASMLTTPATTNTGTGAISPAAVNLDWTQPYSITFNAAVPPALPTYTVTGAIPDVSATPISYTPGSPITVSYNGWTAEITGTPVAGDVFNFDPNTNAAGDNRNALLLAGLQNQNVLNNGTASLQVAYGQLVGQVGAKTNEIAVTSLAQNNMVAETIKAQQSISGVNLDEEAANLIRFQRAYEAAAKAMQISNTMFDAVLALGR